MEQSKSDILKFKCVELIRANKVLVFENNGIKYTEEWLETFGKYKKEMKSNEHQK